MPFTPSHVMAVLPLTRRTFRLDAAALAIGSMAPDFEYFANGRLRGTFGHSLLGIPLFCVPLTLVLLVAWRLRVGRMVAGLVGRAGPREMSWSAGAIASAVIAAAIGAATHLVWDSLTHSAGFFVHHYPVLREQVGPLPLHRIVQHVSSIVGLAVVAIVAIRAIRRRPVVAPPRGRAVFAACVAGGVVLAVVRLAIFHRYELFAPDSLVVAVISGALAGCLAAAFLIKVPA